MGQRRSGDGAGIPPPLLLLRATGGLYGLQVSERGPARQGEAMIPLSRLVNVETIETFPASPRVEPPLQRK